MLQNYCYHCFLFMLFLMCHAITWRDYTFFAFMLFKRANEGHKMNLNYCLSSAPSTPKLPLRPRLHPGHCYGSLQLDLRELLCGSDGSDDSFSNLPVDLF